MPRISRDELLMGVAELMARRGTCARAAVGAVIALEGRIIATGYVGAPPGLPHCVDPDIGCQLGPDGGCIRTVHAEANAVAFAAASGTSTRGAVLYTTHSPCYGCSKLILSAGIARVVYNLEYRDRTGLELLEGTSVQVAQAPTFGISEALREIPWY